jgi:hypothetical protein
MLGGSVVLLGGWWCAATSCARRVHHRPVVVDRGDRDDARRVRVALVSSARRGTGHRRDGGARRGCRGDGGPEHRVPRRAGHRRRRRLPRAARRCRPGRRVVGSRRGGRRRTGWRRDRRRVTVEAPSGPLRFVRFASPPNRLGHCGPIASEGVGQYLHAPIDGGFAELAAQFEGAYPYLELLAGAAHRTDPLDADVVEAYWIGNGAPRPGEHARLRQLDRRPLPPPGRVGVVADRRLGRRRGRPSQLSRAPRDPVDGADAARRRRRAAAHRRPVLRQLGAGDRHRSGRPLVRRRPLVWAGSRLRFGDPSSSR